MEKQSHSRGNTTVCVDPKGHQIITQGVDGRIRIWDSLDDEEPLKTFNVGGNLHSFAVKDDVIYTANEKGNALVSFSLDDGQSQGLVTRFTAPITDIVGNKTHVAAGASDFLVRCVNSQGDVSVLDAHAAPIISLCLAPSTGHLLSASGDGTVKLWIIKTKCCLQTYNILPKVNDASSSLSACRMSWRHDSTQFAVPVGKEIHIFNKNDDEPCHIFKHESILQPINVCSYSEDSSLLASATTDGHLLVWRCQDNILIHSKSISSQASISSLTWLNSQTLLYATNQGSFGSVGLELDEKGESKEGDSSKMSNKEIADMFDGSDDGDFIDGEADEDYKDLIEEHEEEVKSNRKLPKTNVLEDDDESEDSDSEVAGLVHERKNKTEEPAPNVKTETPLAEPITGEQEPFQPGSTPANQKSHYMVWNAVGMILSHTSEGDSTIDIEFHDTTRHHTIHINNTDDYSMADLSETCAVLATEDNGRGRSSILCINYGGGDDKQQWSVTLDKHETVECVTAARDFVAMATSSHMIRGYTTGGFQLAPFFIPGAPVAMAGYRNVLMVAYHTAPAMNSYQHLSLSILTMTGPREILTHCSRLPLSGTSTLSWMGFSCEGTPIIYDSNGFLSMYRLQGHDIWSPIINTKSKDRHKNTFIVSVAEDPPQIRCVSCKGASYPSTSLRPVIEILDYCIPLLGLNTDIGVQEETVWRSRLLIEAANNWLSDKIADTNRYDKQEQTGLLKLFSSACREERLERAYQIASIMSEAYVKLAAQYANRTHEVELAQRLNQLAQQKSLSEGEPVESVFGVAQYSFSGYARAPPAAEEEDPNDELTKFTAARFSAAPNKELASSLIASRQSPLTAASEEAQDIPAPESGKSARISFSNILSQPQEDSQLSQDSQSSRSNPFKRKSSEAVKHTSISDLHKMLDDQEQKKIEQKKALAVSLQPPKTKQSKLFVKSAKASETESGVTDENVEKPRKKATAFDVYHKEKCEGKSRSEAMDKFKALSKETKKMYTRKADQMNQPPEPAAELKVDESDSEAAEKKRKLESPTKEEEGTGKRKTLGASDNTKSKLAAFATS